MSMMGRRLASARVLIHGVAHDTDDPHRRVVIAQAAASELLPDRVFTHFSAAAQGRYLWFAADIQAEFNSLRISGGIKVEVMVDGKEVLSDTLTAGSSRNFSGKQMHVVSGNAAYVKVSVDGKDQGVLGTAWDAEQTYPLSTSP